MKAPTRQNRRKTPTKTENQSRKHRNTRRTPSLAHFPHTTRPTPFGSFQKRPAANSASPLGVARHHRKTSPLATGRHKAIRHQDRKPPKPPGASGIHRRKPETREKQHNMGARGHGAHRLMEKQRRENPKTQEKPIIPKFHRDRWTKRLRNPIANPRIKKRVSHNSRKTSFLSWLFLVFPSIQKHFQNITPGKGKNHPVTRGLQKQKTLFKTHR